MERPTTKKMNEPPKRVYHNRNIKFPNPTSSSRIPLAPGSREAYQIWKRENLLKKRCMIS
jgi:hypothetical protein